MTGIYADIHKKLEIDKWFLFTFYKKIKLLFRVVSVKSLVWYVQNRENVSFTMMILYT